jgi:hypothetical protein
VRDVGFVWRDEARVRVDRGAVGSFVRSGQKACCAPRVRLAISVARVRLDAVRHGFRRPGPIEPGKAHDITPALTIAPCSPPDVHGKGGHAAAGGLQCSRLWEFIQSGQQPGSRERHRKLALRNGKAVEVWLELAGSKVTMHTVRPNGSGGASWARCDLPDCLAEAVVARSKCLAFLRAVFARRRILDSIV